ncbi:MAG: dockerin type I repeat-containing protein [Porcipelethomonas sp.]
MKKIKRILSILSAVIISATGAVSVSAEWSSDPVDRDKIVFSARKEADSNSYYEYYEFWIDENYNINGAYFDMAKAAVRMTDGTEPPYLNSNKQIASKLNKAQIADIQGGGWGAFSTIDIEYTDNLYYISGFESPQAAEEYCQKLLDEKKADYAEPVLHCSYGVASPVSASSDLEKLGVDNSGFADDLYVFYALFEDASAAENFDISSVDGFEENLQAKTVNGNTVYFQFNKEADGETAVKILSNLQKETTVKELYPLSYTVAESTGGEVSSVPPAYDCGDVDRSGGTDVFDAVAIARHTVGKSEFDNVQSILADLNEDGEIDVFDAISVAKETVAAKK